MLAILFRLAVVGGLSAAAPFAHAQLLTHRDLSYAIAKTIAETAIDSCAAKGYGVSAVVVDRAGEVIVALRGDNAGPHTMENARRNAILIPVTNAIERLHEEFKRRIKTQTLLPSAETAAMLFWALTFLRATRG